jgi:serine/threonine-protein kinase RsbW
MTGKVLLRIRAKTCNLVAIREWIETRACQFGADPARIPALMLAVEEAVSNVARHGYGSAGGDLELAMARKGNLLIVRIRDHAVVFDPLAVSNPDLSLELLARPVGGLGIHLIKKSVDRVRHRPLPGGGNELALFMYVMPEGN